MTGFYLVLLLAMAAGFTLTGVYLGLKWNVQVRRGEMPSVELPGVKNRPEGIQPGRAEKGEVSVLDEWLNGAGGKGESKNKKSDFIAF